MTRELTCIVCPKGCKITVEYENNNILSVKGHSCNRGSAYAKDEVICPKRTVTTTVKSKNGTPISVKTDKPIEKSLIFDCMKKINSVRVDLPISIGDIIINNVLGTDVNIIATQNAEDSV